MVKSKRVKDIKDHEEAINIMLDSFKNMVLLVILMILLVQGIVLFMVENYSLNLL